jgi:hypothetical protein
MKRNTFASLVFAAILAGVSFNLQAAALPAVTAQRTDRAPVIDGILDEPVWKEAKWQDGFTGLGMAKAAEPGTRFAVAYDERTLYFAAELAELALDKVKAGITRRDDDRLFSDDCLELFIAPGPQRINYYQFIVNSRGVLTDIEHGQAGVVSNFGWSCNARVATSRGDNLWRVEMSIPLAELDLGPEGAGAWGINVTRERHAGGTLELSTFVPLSGSFQQPGRFASLDLPGSDFRSLRWELSAPAETSVQSVNGELRLHAKVTVKNRSGILCPITLTPTLFQGEKHVTGKPSTDILDAGQVRTYPVALALPAEGPQTLHLTLADRRNAENVYCARSFNLDLRYVPMTLTLTAPAYRDTIYATQKLDDIKGSIACALSKDELSQSKAVVTLFPENTAAPALAGTIINNPSSEMSFSLPVPKLADGRYRLRVALNDAAGQERYHIERILRKLPAAKPGQEWRIEQGILLRDGQPFLPLGWFSIEADALRKQEGLYNLTLKYHAPYMGDAQLLVWLDEVAAAGAFAFLYPFPNEKVMKAQSEPLSADHAAQIRKRVAALKDHPGLLAWYLADEPEYHRTLPERVRQIRELIAEEDPYHPTIMVNNRLDAIRTFREGGDILNPDPYPFFKRGGGPSSSIERVAGFVREAVKVSNPGQSVWVTPQAHNCEDFNGKGDRAPNFTETRNMAWQAVVAGARGISWWAYNYIGNYPDSVLGVPYVARELKALQAYVLAPDAGGLKVKAPQPNHLLAVRRESGARHAVFAVNTALEAQTVTFTVPALAGRTLSVLGEERNVKIMADGVFTDQFKPLATHIYLTDLPEFKGTLTAAQAQIDAANAARKQPGNLAFEDSGVEVTASSTGLYTPSPQRVLDGIRDGMSWRAKDFNGSDWLELAWPQSQQLSRLRIYTDTLADFQVQVPESASGWRSVATVTDAAANPVEIKFEPVRTDRVRINITRLRSGAKASSIWEVEVY